MTSPPIDTLECIAVETCMAPKCQRPRRVGPFCQRCAAAPSTQRAGWVSAARRRVATVCIDASSVAPRLWVGAKPPIDQDIPKVDVLVLCAREYQPELPMFHGKVLRCPMPDGELDRNQINQSLLTSSEVAKALLSGQRVLSTCAMGINRSAFVASLALARLTRLSADQLVALMRKRRLNSCLSNEYFRAYLKKFVGNGRQR